VAYRAVGARILRMQEHVADARLDFYHNAVNSLLSQYDAGLLAKVAVYEG
jgi:hypothetical protein